MPYFSENDTATIVQFMQNHPFAMLTACANDQPEATQIPFIITEEDGVITLRGHIMKKTDHHKAILANPNALVLFTGAHCYVSSSWYSYKGEGATWNYMTVQALGKVEILSDEETITILKELTDHYEAKQPDPQFMRDLPEDYINKYVKAIAGIKIVVKELNTTFKLSQNRDDESYQNIVQHLSQSEEYNAQAIAEELKKRRPQLF